MLGTRGVRGCVHAKEIPRAWDRQMLGPSNIRGMATQSSSRVGNTSKKGRGRLHLRAAHAEVTGWKGDTATPRLPGEAPFHHPSHPRRLPACSGAAGRSP